MLLPGDKSELGPRKCPLLGQLAGFATLGVTFERPGPGGGEVGAERSLCDEAPPPPRPRSARTNRPASAAHEGRAWGSGGGSVRAAPARAWLPRPACTARRPFPR